MKIRIKQLQAIVLGLAILAPNYANATLLTFDDVPGGSLQNRIGAMPTYKGFNFSSTLFWIDTVGSRWNFGAHSGDFTLDAARNSTITAADGSDFTFDGLWAKRWATSPESGGADLLFGTLEGFNNGALVWSVNTGLNGSFKFFAAQTGAIDLLNLGFGSDFLVDDISLNSVASNTSSVPEPAPLALLGFGLLGLGLGRKRRA